MESKASKSNTVEFLATFCWLIIATCIPQGHLKNPNLKVVSLPNCWSSSVVNFYYGQIFDVYLLFYNNLEKIEKALLNDCLRAQKYSKKIAFHLSVIF